MRVVKITVPPDKSISHRAIMLASISEGTTRIKNLLRGVDSLHTIEAFRAMGVEIRPLTLTLSPKGRGKGEGDVLVHGVGLYGLKKPKKVLYLGNSGTTMRLLPGILAGQNFQVVLKGDNSLSKRPMSRIVEPLREMGAKIDSLTPTLSPKGRGRRVRGELYPPLKIEGGRLRPIRFKSKIASAQVKSCILLSALFAKGLTSVSEPAKSRDHTELMLRQFGVRCKVKGLTIEIKGPVRLVSPGILEIPGDISSAAFFIVAGCILPDTKIIIKDVGLNSTRTGILDILKRMGADIVAHSSQLTAHSYEPCGDIIVKSSELKGVTISPKEVVKAIDEIPIIMVAACFAKGRTIIRGVGELRVKETDRIKSMVTNLRRMGANIDIVFEAEPRTPLVRGSASNISNKEIVIINGGRPLHGGRVSSFGDHRTAMSMLVAALGAKGRVNVTGLDCINKSFPRFEDLLHNLLF